LSPAVTCCVKWSKISNTSSSDPVLLRAETSYSLPVVSAVTPDAILGCSSLQEQWACSQGVKARREVKATTRCVSAAGQCRGFHFGDVIHCTPIKRTTTWRPQDLSWWVETQRTDGVRLVTLNAGAVRKDDVTKETPKQTPVSNWVTKRMDGPRRNCLRGAFMISEWWQKPTINRSRCGFEYLLRRGARKIPHKLSTSTMLCQRTVLSVSLRKHAVDLPDHVRDEEITRDQQLHGTRSKISPIN
jgi:hypothetical protein